MKAIPALLVMTAMLGLASACGPVSFLKPPSSSPSPPSPAEDDLVPHVAWLNRLVGPATASVGLPATASALIVYGSSAFKGKGYTEVEVDETLKTVTVKAFYLYPTNRGVSGDMAIEEVMVAFTPAATGMYQIQLANYIDWPQTGTATAGVYVEGPDRDTARSPR